ncbi:MAG: hypothetical protein KDK66_00795 [Deltaproteobacteria bacterium]|nr:hypothetical protein [Deltaproteobacteria bacterium]
MERVRIYKNQQGIAALMAVLSLTFLGLVAISATGLRTTSSKGMVDSNSRMEAEYYALAGQEYAVAQILQGYDPTVTDHSVGKGSFSVSTSGNQVTVTSQYDIATVTRNFEMDMVNACIKPYVNPSLQAWDNSLYGINLYRICPVPPTITEMAVEVIPYEGERVSGITMGGIEVFNEEDGKKANGVSFDIDDFTLPADPVKNLTINRIDFHSKLSLEKSYTITFRFSDGTQRRVSFDDSHEASPGQNPDATPGYYVDDGEIYVEPGFNIQFDVLCADMTYPLDGNSVDLHARLSRNTNLDSAYLFGSVPLVGGESYAEATPKDNSVVYRVDAYAQYGNLWDFEAKSNELDQVKTLLAGSNVPSTLEGFGGSEPVKNCLAPYLNEDSGKVNLNYWESLMLFELGTDLSANPKEVGDFQELVLLVSVWHDSWL